MEWEERRGPHTLTDRLWAQHNRTQKRRNTNSEAKPKKREKRLDRNRKDDPLRAKINRQNETEA